MSQVENLSIVPAAPPSSGGRLRLLDLSCTIFAIFLVLVSIVMFLLNRNAKEISALLTAQNAAALKLESDIKYYEQFHLPNSKLPPPDLFEDLVTFSRNNANIIYTVHRFYSWNHDDESFNIMSLLQRLTPRDGSNTLFDHIAVKPEISPDIESSPGDNIVTEAFYQIKLYQAIRDDAQTIAESWHSALLAVSTYILPILYALLGALLYALRNSAADGVALINRLVMAGIAGFAVSRLNDLLPQEVLLSPLAVAFVVGYSTEILIGRLDAFISKVGAKS
jgi:hypothetical protein